MENWTQTSSELWKEEFEYKVTTTRLLDEEWNDVTDELETFIQSLLDEKDKEIERLKEYEWKYNDLCK